MGGGKDKICCPHPPPSGSDRYSTTEMGCRLQVESGKEDQSMWLNPDTDKFLWAYIPLALQVTEEGLSHLSLPVTLKCDTKVC